jgi:hypothetical protein
VSATVVVLDPMFDAATADAMVELAHRFGSYRMYAEVEQYDTPISAGLSPRHDAVMNFVNSGGIEARDEPLAALAVRTSYFREEYAYGTNERIEGIGPFLRHPAFIEAAQAIHGRAVIEPAIAYANLMVPGQELAVHTDVPEFRGANRKLLPQWLLVVMHHSGLFEEYRMPIATTIAWLGPRHASGGALAYWPDGPNGEKCRHPARFNTAIVLDTDSVFHGVEEVASVPADALPPIRYGTTLDYVEGSLWELHDCDGKTIGGYDWEVLRFSVSWKAYCFRDEHERDAWRTHSDDLTLDMILDRLVDDLVARGRVERNVERDAKLGEILIDEYVRFPSC